MKVVKTDQGCACLAGVPRIDEEVSILWHYGIRRTNCHMALIPGSHWWDGRGREDLMHHSECAADRRMLDYAISRTT